MLVKYEGKTSKKKIVEKIWPIQQRYFPEFKQIYRKVSVDHLDEKKIEEYLQKHGIDAMKVSLFQYSTSWRFFYRGEAEISITDWSLLFFDILFELDRCRVISSVGF